ncbi:unnamed protein product [Brassica oleracea var. botrytis]|uniref:(rape) hypothetical protein n=1 Tax=Brassica napus TaxID=3708 RepID=A0A078JIN6_BRANA|nr:uncharacterized protein LOC106381261 [Brassica napus]CAF1910121.1 unnamed protein product [Brassica napus]CDY66320.1 BnaCnng50280D [Brassica napus]
MVSFAGFAFITGFLLGILTIVAAEVAGFLYLLKRLNRKRNLHESNKTSSDPPNSIDFSLNKQGVIWILESDEGLKDWMNEKLPKEQKKKKKKDLLEVHPVRKSSHIKDHKLILLNADGTQKIVFLKGCSVEAVSGSDLPTRKWAKRYPIKVESKTSNLHKGNRVFYIFLETSWEKESWCKALRVAACNDQERATWPTKLKHDFQNYIASLNVAYPSFMKQPSSGFDVESLDNKGVKIDAPSSKVRLLWKKFSRKKVPNREDKKTSSTRHYQDSSGSSGRSTPAIKVRDNNIPEETEVQAFSRSWSHGSHVSDVDSEDKFYTDEGTLAWNLLISRLFFDVKLNTGIKTVVHERIQRVLSNMRLPSYIGDLICCDVRIGNLPPYIDGARVLPVEMNGVWAFELDIEYTGGAGLVVETRVDARAEDLQKGIAEGKLQPSPSGDVPIDLLEGLEEFEKQLSVPGGTVEVKTGGSDKPDESKGSKGTNNGSKWKSILKNIAEQVSQVPINLSIGVSSLRGTLRVHMKPPPSDQLWLSFTTMPDIHFDLVSSVGDHKITNSHVATFLINKFKNGIREVMVLPNCENVTIPWMIAEKDDWVQRSVAPFMWLNQDSDSDHDSFEAAEVKPKADKPPSPEQTKKVANVHQKPRTDEEPVASSPSAANSAAPIVESEDTIARGGNDEETTPVSVQSSSRSIFSSEEDDLKGRQIGRKERIFDFRKKFGEKFEEKKRHVEERSKQIVEKMRGP